MRNTSVSVSTLDFLDILETFPMIVMKSLLVQEKEKLYLELKNILARQPGPEVAEQITVYQANLRNKSRQLKAMASQLNMFQAQVNEYKYEVERVTRELQDLKRKYYQQKRKDQMMQELEMEGGMGMGIGMGMPPGHPSNSVGNLSSVGSAAMGTVPGRGLLSKTAPQTLQSDQVTAAKNARTRFTGGGFAIK